MKQKWKWTNQLLTALVPLFLASAGCSSSSESDRQLANNGQTEDGSLDKSCKTYYYDADGDGYGGSTTTTVCSGGAPAGYVPKGGDCNDNNAAVGPKAKEICDGLDNDCDGSVDEGVKLTFYRDQDGDTYGTSAQTTSACTAPTGYVSNATDCNDANAAINPGAAEIPGDQIDQNCDTDELCYLDHDNDGYRPDATSTETSSDLDCTDNKEALATDLVGDCDDKRSDTYPGAAESCNGNDDNCDGVVDDGFDADGDGYSSCGKCDDDDGDSDDDDGDSDDDDDDGDSDDDDDDGDSDDDDDDDKYSSSSKSDDDDDDGDSDDDDGDGDDDDYSCGADCNDADASINPGATEACNGVDDNCDGLVDNAPDADGDGFTMCTGDCNDADGSVNPSATEICNGKDDDCDVSVDEGFDVDNDGYNSCSGDCDDNNPAVNPEEVETCNGIDDDCDGLIDDGFDGDVDGFTSCGGDCDDANQNVNPAAAETCNGIDDNCDTAVDEGFDSDSDGIADCFDSEECDGLDNDGDGQIDEGFDSDNDGTADCFDSEECDGLDNDGDGEIDEGFDSDNDTTADCFDSEECDGLDNDGDGEIDEGFDSDSDGTADCFDTEECDLVDNDGDGQIDEGFDADVDGFTSCGGDCDDTNGAINPDATESCNGIDDDCDGPATGEGVGSNGLLLCEAELTIQKDSAPITLEQGEQINFSVAAFLNVSGSAGYYVNWFAGFAPADPVLAGSSQIEFPFGFFDGLIFTDTNGQINIALKTQAADNTLAAPGLYTLTLTGTTNTGYVDTAFVSVTITEAGAIAPFDLLALNAQPDSLTVADNISTATEVLFSVAAVSADPLSLPAFLTLQRQNGLIWDDIGVLFDDGVAPDLAIDGFYVGTALVVHGTVEGTQTFRAVATSGMDLVASDLKDIVTTPFIIGPDPGDGSISSNTNEFGEHVLCNIVDVIFVDGITSEQADDVAAEQGGFVLSIIPGLGIYQISTPLTTCTVAQVDAIIAGYLGSMSGLVLDAFAEVVASSDSFPNDAQFGFQSYMSTVRANEAWYITKGTILIGSVDTGVDYNVHPELPLTTKIIKGYDYVSNDSEPTDPSGHGTHTAGIMAAAGDNAVGIAGISWDSKILAVRGIGTTTSATVMASAINYAVSNGAKIINISGGVDTPSSVLNTAVNNAVSAGALIVAAAGNTSATTARYPASYSGVIGVAGTNPDDTRWVNSRYGAWVDLAAPAVSIRSTHLGGGYADLTGTSQSSAIVAGAAALVWSEHPGWTATQVRARLEQTAKPLDTALQIGKRIDVFEAVFNGSFETGDLGEWSADGTCQNMASLGPILPPNNGGTRMAYCSTGPADAETDTVFTQNFVVTANVASVPITFQYNFITEEYPEFIGYSDFSDSLYVGIESPVGTTSDLEMTSVDELGFFQLTDLVGVDFPGGDTTLGYTGWVTVTGTVDLTAGPGQYRLVVADADDALWDTAVLIDRVRFSSF